MGEPGPPSTVAPLRHPMQLSPTRRPYHHSMIIEVTGAFAAAAARVRPHPCAKRLWLADIVLAENGSPVQIVFGGERAVKEGEFVPFAPPGAKVTVYDEVKRTASVKRIRARNYRGQRSYGMLCSSDELGWTSDGPDEVAVLRNVRLGQRLDDVPDAQIHRMVREWDRARKFARTRTAQAPSGALLLSMRPTNGAGQPRSAARLSLQAASA